jgi:aminoglycoside 6'-N-acetyltransferase
MNSHHACDRHAPPAPEPGLILEGHSRTLAHAMLSADLRSEMRTPATPLNGELTIVRPATSADADLLVRWHADPDVAEFWDGKTFTREQILGRLNRSGVDAYVIEAAGEPVGYVQAWFGAAADECGIDMFIIPSARGRGFGPDSARTLAQYLVHETGRTRVTVDPYLWNDRAVRAWRRAGFRPVEKRAPDHEHAHAWLLMTFDPALSGPDR